MWLSQKGIWKRDKGSAVRTGNPAASRSKKFLGKLFRFGQIWLDLGNIKAKFRQN